MTWPHTGKYFQRYYKAFPLQKRKRLCLQGSATVCSPSLNCPSRCTEMETSYSVQLPAQSSIVLLASNVTRLGSQCETDHCAHWRRLQLWVKRTDDWTQTAALNCHCFQEMEPLTVMWLIEKLLSFLSFQLVSPISKSPRGPLQSRRFSVCQTHSCPSKACHRSSVDSDVLQSSDTLCVTKSV